MFCSNCGKELQDEWAVCPNCGQPVEQTSPEQTFRIWSVSEYRIQYSDF
ncbi:zinc ribbon domain-containing protein [Clostridium sp. AM54-37XD]|nr:zinc ribbon domain-containing protein [Clostridium sp. AM54-37XD]